MLALKFLPLDAAPIALIVTDGVADYPSPMEYDGLSMRLCRYDVAVSCLLVDRMGSRVVARGAGRIGAITVMTKGVAAAAAAERRGTRILGARVGVAGGGGTAGEGQGGKKRDGVKYETDRLGIDFSPHGEAYSASRKHRIPDLNGLAHLVGVTGGWFYDLETLEAELGNDGSNGSGGGNVSYPGAAGGGGARQGSAGQAFQGTGSVWQGCGGPSPALCKVRFVADACCP